MKNTHSRIMYCLAILILMICSCNDSSESSREKAKDFSKYMGTRIPLYPSFSGCEQLENAGDRIGCTEQKILKLVEKNITYPERLKESMTEGFVDYEFTVTSQGDIQNVVVTKTFDEECGEMVKNALQKLPKMIPPTNEGKPTESKYTSRFVFKIPQEEIYQITTMYGRNDFFYSQPISTLPIFGKCKAGAQEEMEACLSKNLYDYFQAALNFPPVPAKSQKITTISFMVDKSGAIKKINGGALWKKEIEEMIYKMPKWTAGKKDGQAVNTIFKIMHNFTAKSLRKVKPNRQKMKQLKGNPANERPASLGEK